MKKYDLKFSFNSTDKIIIKLKEPLAEVDCCYMTDMMLQHLQQTILLSTEPIFFNMQRFAELLNRALDNKLFLHESINADIGYLSNEYYQNKNGLVRQDLSENSSEWLGYLYYLWEGSRKNIRYVTWLYNDKNSDIVFEVTPAYPYLFCDPDEEPNYIPYEEWIKSYKPYFIAVLSRDLVAQWLQRANEIIEQIKMNIERLKKEYEEKEG